MEHRDYTVLQEVLRLSRSFLSGVNESSQGKREVTLSHGMVGLLLYTIWIYSMWKCVVMWFSYCIHAHFVFARVCTPEASADARRLRG